MKHIREQYQGRLSLQVMFINANKQHAREIATIAKEISPDEVQLNTPLRPSAVKPLIPRDIDSIREEFHGLKNVVSVYEATRPEVNPLDLKETLKRRPRINT